MKRQTVPLMMITLLLAPSTAASAEPLRPLAWAPSTEFRRTADLSEELPRGLEEAVELYQIDRTLFRRKPAGPGLGPGGSDR